MRQCLKEHFGGYENAIAAGLTVRHDHGSQFMSKRYQTEISFLCAASSPSFVREPEGNGVTERF
jgi:transposase InsO family protein